MIIPDNEVLGPEHLAELGVLFDKTWEVIGSSVSTGKAEERAQLASILLRLYGLRQLGPDQVMQTALRLLNRSSPEVMSASNPATSAGALPTSV